MKLEYPMEYFLDEIRDGFFIPSMMKRTWASQMECYKTLEQETDKIDGTVILTFGTLIGAIRGGGYIAWDDDIDVEMIREDMVRLKAVSDAHELPDEYVLFDYEMGKEDNQVRKFHDSETMVLDQSKWEGHYGLPFASTIDIFPIDCIPKGRKEQDYYFDKLVHLIYCKTIADKLKKRDAGEEIDIEIDEKEFYDSLHRMEKELDVKFDRDSNNRPDVMQLRLMSDKFSERYTMEDCDSLISVPYFVRDNAHRFPKKYYDTTIDVEYEGLTMKAPAGYDDILRSFYGNYMMPGFTFGGHDYPIYRVQETFLKEMFDIELIHYHYIESEVERIKSEREQMLGLRDEIVSSVGLFKEAHDYIIDKQSEGTSDESCLEVLGQCQDLAIGLGERAERKAIDSDEFVSAVESYCECIYQIYQGMSGEEAVDDSQIAEGLKNLKSYEDLYLKLSENIKERIEVVFLSYNPEHWKSMHSLWEEVERDKDAFATVIPIPYYYKGFDGNIIKDDIQYNSDAYPEEIQVVSYEEYDFERNHPDIIIYQCPYDEYNDAMTIHPYFYVKNLYKYTDCMVLLPYFTLREIIPEDERSRVMFKNYLQTPGAVFADRIYAQSENMRDVYIELLDKFLAEEIGEDIDYIKEKHIWDQVVSGDGSPLYDWENQRRKVIVSEKSQKAYTTDGREVDTGGYDDIVTVPDEWIDKTRREDGTLKKVILVQLNGSVLLTHGNIVISKTTRAMQLIREFEDDITILYLADTHVEEILKKSEPETLSDYVEFINMLKSTDGVIYDGSGNQRRAAAYADAFYGDGCIAMNECRIQKKPVLMESYRASLEGTRKYEYQKWVPETLIAEEGWWTLRNFVEEVLKFEPVHPKSGNAERIWDDIKSNTAR